MDWLHKVHVSIPSKSGFHSNKGMPAKYAPYDSSQSLRNQGFIRTGSGGKGKDEVRSQSLRKQGFIRTALKAAKAFEKLSQSLRNQGFIRTNTIVISSKNQSLNPFEIRVSFEPLVRKRKSRRQIVSIPSRSGFHSNRSDGQRFLAVEFQRIRSNFIRSVVTFL